MHVFSGTCDEFRISKSEAAQAADKSAKKAYALTWLLWGRFRGMFGELRDKRVKPNA